MLEKELLLLPQAVRTCMIRAGANKEMRVFNEKRNCILDCANLSDITIDTPLIECTSSSGLVGLEIKVEESQDRSSDVHVKRSAA